MKKAYAKPPQGAGRNSDPKLNDQHQKRAKWRPTIGIDKFTLGNARRVFATVFLCAVIAAMIALWFISNRNHTMERLYAEAAMRPGYWRGSAESAEAARKLAAYRGRYSSSLLLDLAVGQNYSMPLAPDVQIEAIKALQHRTDPEIPMAMASLLQPHNGLEVRMAAAQTLQNLPCKGECIRYILHYLERVQRGEPNFEDTIVTAAPINRAATDRQQKDLCETLRSVLRREEDETIVAVRDIYGIGSGNPSPFALELVSRLALTRACPLVVRSDRELRDIPPQLVRGPRQELQAAISTLHCK